ncbi:MAG: hypothetical protein C0501_04345 [Isosphaera sp.]|nr:hypothetical protein [Isosphaera sp.]
MPITRRRLLATTAVAATAPLARAADEPKRVTADLDRVLKEPVLKLDAVKAPVKAASIELLRNGPTFLLRARTADGLEAVTVPNPAKMAVVYPFLLKSVLPVFVGKDARDLEKLLWDVYRHASNYKMQGVALWVCVAAVEMCLLDLLGRAANRPVRSSGVWAKCRSQSLSYTTKLTWHFAGSVWNRDRRLSNDTTADVPTAS